MVTLQYRAVVGRAKAFSAPLLTLPTSQESGAARGDGGDTGGTVTPNDPRDIPDHKVSCSACRAGGRRKSVGHSE